MLIYSLSFYFYFKELNSLSPARTNEAGTHYMTTLSCYNMKKLDEKKLKII